jgi:hypothetical protein
MKLEDIDSDDLIGAVKYKANWRFFICTVAEWILDYSTYDPSFSPSHSKVVFRNNLLKVDEVNVSQFLEAIQEYEISYSELEELIKKNNINDWPLQIVVDFDEMIYINGFSEIGLHEYIPSHWRGFEGLPLEFVPENIKKLWK